MLIRLAELPSHSKSGTGFPPGRVAADPSELYNFSRLRRSSCVVRTALSAVLRLLFLPAEQLIERATEIIATLLQKASRRGQQVLQLHLGDLLDIGRNNGMVHVPSNQDGEDQLTILVGERRVEIAAHTSAANRLAVSLVQHCGHVQVEALIDEVDRSGCGHGADIQRRLQVVGLGDAVVYVEGAGHLRDGGVALGPCAAELANLRQLVYQVDLGKFAVGQVQPKRSVQGLNDVARGRRGEGDVRAGGQSPVQRVLRRRKGRQQLVRIYTGEPRIERVRRRVLARINGDASGFLPATDLRG